MSPFQQLWPPAHALTLLALADPEDTRKGWARWTWIPGQPMVLHGRDLLGEDRPPSDDPETVRDWAQAQGWAQVTWSGPWAGDAGA